MAERGTATVNRSPQRGVTVLRADVGGLLIQHDRRSRIPIRDRQQTINRLDIAG
jgi:hypothetical protein